MSILSNGILLDRTTPRYPLLMSRPSSVKISIYTSRVWLVSSRPSCSRLLNGTSPQVQCTGYMVGYLFLYCPGHRWLVACFRAGLHGPVLGGVVWLPAFEDGLVISCGTGDATTAILVTSARKMANLRCFSQLGRKICNTKGQWCNTSKLIYTSHSLNLFTQFKATLTWCKSDMFFFLKEVGRGGPTYQFIH